jgi:hypothetical protein
VDALRQATSSYDHGKLAIMLHTAPRVSPSDIKETIQSILSVGHSLWLTETCDYTAFGSYFPISVDCLHELLS